jgi:hypothetical protein
MKIKLQKKKTFLGEMKGPEASIKYMCQFDIEENNILMCSKAKNEIFRQRAQG